VTIDGDFEEWIFDCRNLTFTEFRFWKAGHGVCCYLDANPVWASQAETVTTGVLRWSLPELEIPAARTIQLVR
jgi:hypothetical protein